MTGRNKCEKCGGRHLTKNHSVERHPQKPAAKPAAEKPKTTLYERTADLQQLLDEVTDLVDVSAEANTDDRPMVSDLLDEKAKELLAEGTEAFGDKVERVALFYLEQQREKQVIDTETARLQKRSAVVANRLDWWKEYMRSSMVAVEVPKVATPLVTVRVQKTAPLVELLDIDDVPESMRRQVPAKTELDKKLALAYYKRHKDDPPGCRVRDGRTTLVVA